MQLLKTIINRKWRWVTLVVIIGMIFLARLGFWQLDRQQQRRDYNQMLTERWNHEPLNVNTTALPSNLDELAFRRISAKGHFDYAQQMILVNQPDANGSPGVIVLTPLVLDQKQAILVARGWVSYELSKPENWKQFEEPADAAIVGLIQASQTNPDTPIPTEQQIEWHRIDIPAIQHQLPYQLLPVFLLQLPEPGRTYSQLPLREIPEDFQLSEGNHFSYAIQWFSFAVMFGFIYLQYVRQQDLRAKRLQNEANPPTTEPIVSEHAI